MQLGLPHFQINSPPSLVNCLKVSIVLERRVPSPNINQRSPSFPLRVCSSARRRKFIPLARTKSGVDCGSFGKTFGISQRWIELGLRPRAHLHNIAGHGLGRNVLPRASSILWRMSNFHLMLPRWDCAEQFHNYASFFPHFLTFTGTRSSELFTCIDTLRFLQFPEFFTST